MSSTRPSKNEHVLAYVEVDIGLGKAACDFPRGLWQGNIEYNCSPDADQQVMRGKWAAAEIQTRH